MDRKLNDDCLMCIFELLDIKDQLNLIEVCEHFRFLIIDCMWSKKYRNIHTQMNDLQCLSIGEYKKFFQYNAENIQKLDIEDTKHYAFTSYLNRFTNRPDFSFYFSLKMSNLKELYCHDTRLHDGYIHMLTKYCPLLEILHTDSSHVTGNHMDQLKMLREVRMADRIITFQRNSTNNPPEGSQGTLCVCWKCWGKNVTSVLWSWNVLKENWIEDRCRNSQLKNHIRGCYSLGWMDACIAHTEG